MGEEPSLEPQEQESAPVVLPHTESKSTSTPPTKLWLRLIPLALAFIVASLVFHFRLLSSLTLPHIIEPEGTFQFQEVVEGLPIPNLLAWNLSLVHWMMWFDRLAGYPLWLGSTMILLIVGIQAISLVNPTFRLFQVKRAESANGAHVLSLDSNAIAKCLLVTLRILLPLVAIWLLTARLPDQLHLLTTLLRCVVLGILLWLGFHPQGMAGDFTQPQIQPLGSGASRLVAHGSLFGLGVGILQSQQYPLPTQEIMTYYHTLATFHRGYWSEIATPFLASSALIALGSALLLVALSGSHLPKGSRLTLLCIPLLFLPPLALSRTRNNPTLLKKQWDITPETLGSIVFPYSTERPRPTAGVPDGMAAGKVLMKEAGIAAPRRDGNPLLFFSQRGLANLRQMHFTEDGLPLDANSEKAVASFLERRHYNTALSWIIFKHVYNVGASNFDTNKALSACMLSLQRAPHSFQIMTTLQMMLFTCPATKDNLAIVDQLADERYFTHIDRASKRVMGDLYLRFGESQKAMDWYRRAEMPKSFLQRVETSKPMFNVGTISGSLLLNGKPLAGVKIGVHPVRLNGLPKTLEMLVLRSGAELFAPFYDPRFPLFPRFHPRPFALRWVTAGTTTDQNGKFNIDHLIEGEYELVIALPSNIQLEPPFDARLKVKNPADPVTLNYNLPKKDLGIIEITAPVSNNAITFDSPTKAEPTKATK